MFIYIHTSTYEYLMKPDPQPSPLSPTASPHPAPQQLLVANPPEGQPGQENAGAFRIRSRFYPFALFQGNLNA
jgi:hypothetical protein